MFKPTILRPFVRFYTAVPKPTYYQIFHQTFQKGGPPTESFVIDLKKLRKEYRQLQSENHPDILLGSTKLKDFVPDSKEDLNDAFSSLLNKAYTTLKDPLTRSQYTLNLLSGIDVSKDETAKTIMSKDKEMLMVVLEAHEQLEEATTELELDELKSENDSRIKQSELELDALFKARDYEQVAIETVRLKYWSNISSAIRDWEPGKQVHLTH